jgi:hypothetical protein
MVMKETDLGCGWVPLYTENQLKYWQIKTKSDKEGKIWGEWVRTVNRRVNWRGKCSLDTSLISKHFASCTQPGNTRFYFHFSNLKSSLRFFLYHSK